MIRELIVLASLVLLPYPVIAAQLTAKMQVAEVSGPGVDVGEVVITQTAYGLLFTPNLHGLPVGSHGFHIHESGSCAPGMKDGKSVPALAAGDHYDPQKTKKHLGPYQNGHLGDLPPLIVNEKGDATYPVFSPRLKSLKAVSGRALMIHAMGDNYADAPEKLGGGGARIICGVIH